MFRSCTVALTPVTNSVAASQQSISATGAIYPKFLSPQMMLSLHLVILKSIFTRTSSSLLFIPLLLLPSLLPYVISSKSSDQRLQIELVLRFSVRTRQIHLSATHSSK